MQKCALIIVGFVCAAIALLQAAAQPPGGKDKAKDFGNSTIVTAILAFDKDKSGKVTKEQVSDTRLHRLFDQADANKDGVATREELIVLATKLETALAQEGGGGFGGPGKGKDGKGKDGKGGFGKDGPPQPGQILPPFLRDGLNLTAEQIRQIDELQHDVDAKLGRILTEEQKRRLQEMRERGPGGFGGPGKGGPGKGGPGKGPGGPGSPPPG